MSHQVRCPCLGHPDCKLCGSLVRGTAEGVEIVYKPEFSPGTKYYSYEPGPRGWMPFVCPTCEGKREVTVEGESKPEKCFTCAGAGSIDPALPPRDKSTRGFIRDIWRIFFGG